MLSEKICFSNGITENDREYCETASELFNSKGLYIILERFSNIIKNESPEFDDFLNRYFNDEGYVDIWRIPHLLMDLESGNCEFHANLLEDEEFRRRFISYIGEFYNYCIKKCNLLMIDEKHFTDYRSTMFHIRKNQCLYNLITETYCKVYERLNSYGEVKKA